MIHFQPLHQLCSQDSVDRPLCSLYSLGWFISSVKKPEASPWVTFFLQKPHPIQAPHPSANPRLELQGLPPGPALTSTRSEFGLCLSETHPGSVGFWSNYGDQGIKATPCIKVKDVP